MSMPPTFATCWATSLKIRFSGRARPRPRRDCHAAALSSPWEASERFWESNVRPTELLVRAAETHGVERLVLISTPSMYFQMTSQWDLKEEDPLPKPINQYAASKREAERVVEASEIPHVILRPRALLGRGDIPSFCRASFAPIKKDDFDRWVQAKTA